MKKWICIVSIIIVFITTFMGLYVDANSIRQAEIINMTTEKINNKSITTIETADGNLWELDGKIKTGNIITFDTMGTNTIYDDVVIDIK